MKIYDEAKTRELKTSEIDLKKGYLVNDTLRTGSTPAFTEHIDDERGVFDIVHPEEPVIENIQIYKRFTDAELKERRKLEIQQELDSLSKDIIQALAGENVPDIDMRKQIFVKAHNELRELLGKEKREVQ